MQEFFKEKEMCKWESNVNSNTNAIEQSKYSSGMNQIRVFVHYHQKLVSLSENFYWPAKYCM